MALAAATCVLLAVILAAATFHYTVWLRDHSMELETEVARANRNADLANRNGRLLNRHLHAAQLRLAGQVIENGQLERAQDILNDELKRPGEDDPRDFAWHVLWERATRQISPLYGHERNVRAMALSPDGRTLASGDEVGTVRLWDAQTGTPLADLKGHDHAISRLAFSADGGLLATAADADGHSRCAVFLWEAASGRELARIEGLDNWIAAVPAFLRNEPALRLHAAQGDSTAGDRRESSIWGIRTYDLSHGPSRLVPRSSWISSDYSCLSQAGQVVTFLSTPLSHQDRFRFTDAETGHIEWAFDSARFGNQVLSTFTPDGRVVAAAFGKNTVSCRETSTGRELFRFTSESPLRALALSSDGRALMGACESGVVELHSLATGRKLPLSISDVPRTGASLRFAFSPDGSRLATTEWAVPGGATPVTTWDVSTGKRLGQYPGQRDRAAQLLFASDSRSLFVAAGPAIHRWFLERESEPPPFGGHTDEAWSVAFSADGAAGLGQ